MSASTTSHDELLEHLRHGRVDAARAIVAEQHRAPWSVDGFIDDFIAPLQVQVGLLWEQGRWSVADEHRATASWQVLLDDVVVSPQCRPVMTGPGSEPETGCDRPITVAMATVAGDWHLFPAQLAAARLHAAGIHTQWLGGPVPDGDLAAWLGENPVDLMVLTCSMGARLAAAGRSVTAARALEVPVVLGGQAVTGARAGALGAAGGGASGRRLVPLVRSVVAGARAGAGAGPTNGQRSIRAWQPATSMSDVGRVESARHGALDAAHDQLRRRLGIGRTVARWWFEDLVDSVAGAVAVREPDVLTAHLRWMLRALGSEGVSAEAVGAAAIAAVEVLVETLGPSGSALYQACRSGLAEMPGA